jgi:hypothetical protein
MGRELGIRVWGVVRAMRGQTAAEYLGVLLVISALIAALVTTDIGHDITSKLTSLVRDISGK